MNRKTIRLTALVLLIQCMYTDVIPAQAHRARRTPATQQKLTPLTEWQKDALTDLIARADELEVTYRYTPSKFSDESADLSSGCKSVAEEMPEGQVKDVMLKMGQAYEDAGIIYGTATGTGLRTRSYEVFNESRRSKGEQTWNYLGEILSTYNVEHLAPYDAQRAVFNNASALKRRLQVYLRKSPTLKEEM